MRTGFTLIELSIVLVIIGLIVGGILVGQSLINTARISNFIKYVSQLDSAVVQFQEKFKCLPGDCSKLGGPGNNSGYIGAKCALIPGAVAGDCYSAGTFASINPEARYFWQHLSISGFKPDGVVYEPTGYTGFNDGGLGINFPKVGSFANQGTIKINDLLHDKGWPGGGWGRVTRNNFSFGTLDSRQHNAAANIVHGGFVNPVTLMAIDKKMDDGTPVLGHIIINPVDSFEFGSCAKAGSVPLTYDLDNDERACSVVIGFGFTTGSFDLYNETHKTLYGY